MLQGMRRHANSYLMSLMFAVIIVVFVFSFGPGSARYCGQEPTVAARVNHRVITAAELQQQYARRFEYMQRIRPDYSIEKARSENLQQQVLDDLIARELLIEEALDRGITVTDQELADYIVKLPLFQREGKFDQELYHRYATSLNLSAAGFEEQLRRDLISDRMRTLLRESVSVGEKEIRELWERRNNRADLWVVKLDPLHFKAQVQVADAEVQRFASEQKARVEDHYNKNATRYNKPERVRARHILIKVADDASSDDEAKARGRIEAAKARLDKGEDFAAVARELSEDSSAPQGGDLGAQARGAWVKPFEDAAFALAPGATSDIVRSQFGFHIIKVEEKIPAVSRAVDDVTEEIARELLEEDEAKVLAQRAATEWQTKLAAAEDPETLNPKVEGEPDPFAPKVESTGLFQKGQRYLPKVGVAPEVATAAFDLSPEKPTPEAPLESSGRFYAIRLKERQAPDPAKFDEDRDRLRTELETRRQLKIIDEYVKGLRARATIETFVAAPTPT